MAYFLAPATQITAASVTITINVTINPGANNVFNQGTVNFDADGNGTNESSALTDNPAAAGPADPTGFQVAFSIPANATWALLLLAGLMLVVVWQVRQTDPQR